MSVIRVLPQEIADLIAAGEVVERPASAVKELLENAIDAGATDVTVEIKNGGVRYIRVTDNGCGIDRADVRTAFLPHATSKLQSREDLFSIGTFGFRGEALASIAAVAAVEVLTCTQDAPIGTRYRIAGSREESIEDAGCPKGTTIVVRDLFYNTPARMKFLKKDATEAGYVFDAVTRTALSHPAVRIKLIRDGKRVFLSPGDGKAMTVIRAVFGGEFAAGLIPCEGRVGPVAVSGYVSRPLFAKPNRHYQHFFVNDRYVRLPVAAPALDNAYQSRIMAGKFPACVLFLTIDTHLVDVNVHPAKTLVRFSDEKAVYDAVYFAAVTALDGDAKPYRAALTHTPDRSVFGEKKDGSVQMTLSAVTEDEPEPPRQTPVEPQETPALADVYRNVRPPKPRFFRQPERVWNAPDESREPDLIPGDIPAPQSPRQRTEPPQTPPIQDALPQTAPDAPAPEFRLVGELFKTYILIEQNNKLIFIDKHALHERIRYNELKAGEKAADAQMLLSPVPVTLTQNAYDAVIASLELLEKCGWLTEDFGDRTVLVRSCPTALSGEDAADAIQELAEGLAAHARTPIPEKLEWIYRNTACRGAVKEGDDLSEPEMRALAKRVLTDESLRYCPHGRPILFEMSAYELNKAFGREG